MAGNNLNTVLLLACNGADESTIIPDSSVGGNGGSTHGNATVVGTAQLDTALKKWGTSSLKLDGNSDYLTIPDSTDWDIGANFTLDMWVYPTDSTGQECFVSQYENPTNQYFFGLYLSHLAIWIDGGAADVNIGAGSDAAAGEWSHVAYIKVGSDWGTYLNGVQQGYQSANSTTAFAAPLLVGASTGSGLYFDGNIDEPRIQHSNYFGAAPNSTPDDTITVPTKAYGIRRVMLIT